jgi:molybdopterin-guanine dinucleotide biosynthesis protein A
VQRPIIDAVLLAGGLSQRFGRPKAVAMWRGHSLAEHVLAALPESVGKTVLVLRDPADPVPVKTDVLTHDNPVDPEGPLRGIVAGLRCCTAPLAWGLACDMPGLVPGVLDLLVREYQPGDAAVVPVWEGRRQPLCALYHVDAVAGLAVALDQGIHSLQGALKTVEFRELPEDLIRTVDPDGLSFHNVNTPEDLVSLSGQLPTPEQTP